VSVLSIGGIEVVTRAASGTMVLACCCRSNDAGLGAADGGRVAMDGRLAAGSGDAGEVFLMDETPARLTPLQWLIRSLPRSGSRSIRTCC